MPLDREGGPVGMTAEKLGEEPEPTQAILKLPPTAARMQGAGASSAA